VVELGHQGLGEGGGAGWQSREEPGSNANLPGIHDSLRSAWLETTTDPPFLEPRAAGGQKFGPIGTKRAILAQPEHEPGRLLDRAKITTPTIPLGVAVPPWAPPLGFLMMFRTRLLASLIACATFFAPGPAQAEPTAAEISAAKQAFESALAAESGQRWADAALKLREAIAVKETPGLRFHLAHCETELGHLVDASLEYDRALELLRQGAKAPDVQKLLGPARASLLERLPRLTVDIPADVQAARVTIDGRPYPPSELALGVPLDPGLHELRVQATGRRAFERALSLKEGDRILLSAALPLAAPAADGPGEAARTPEAPQPARSNDVTPPPEGRPSSTKLYLLIGESVLTAAGLGVGIGYAIARGAASDRIAAAQARIDGAAPGNPMACGLPDSELVGACSDLNAAFDDHYRATIISQIGFVTAGVGAAALLTTWLVYPNPRGQGSGFRVQPVAGPGQIGVVGRF